MSNTSSSEGASSQNHSPKKFSYEDVAQNATVLAEESPVNGFELVEISGTRFWRCKECLAEVEKARAKKQQFHIGACILSVLTRQRKDGPKFDTGNLLNHKRGKHKEEPSVKTPAAKHAVVQDQVFRFLTSQRLAFTAVDAASFKEFCRFVREVRRGYLEHWDQLGAVVTWIAMLAKEVAQFAISEAAVERGFAEMIRQFTAERNRLGNGPLEDVMFSAASPWTIERPAFQSFPALPPVDCEYLFAFLLQTSRDMSVASCEKLRKGDKIGVIFTSKKPGAAGVLYEATIMGRHRQVEGRPVFKVTWGDGSVGDFDPTIDYQWWPIAKATDAALTTETDVSKVLKGQKGKRQRDDDAPEDE